MAKSFANGGATAFVAPKGKSDTPLADRLRAHANAARDCGLISEQVWRDMRHAADELYRLYAIPEPDVKRMVDRFLWWKLPSDFAPDCHISFKLPDPVLNPNPSWPVGTNLFTAEQARQMVEHMLAPDQTAEGGSK